MDDRFAAGQRSGPGNSTCSLVAPGATGPADTTFSEDLNSYLDRCRASTRLPLALGFGVKDAQDVEMLTGKADLAVIGTQTIRVMEEEGVDAVKGFIEGLR